MANRTIKTRSRRGQTEKSNHDATATATSNAISDRKARLAKARLAREERQKFINSCLAAFFLGGIIGTPLMFTVSFKAGFGVLIAIICLMLSYQYPRKALWAFLIYMPFSGTVTYWVGGGNALFQLSKDVFYFPALIGLIKDCRQKRRPLLVVPKLLPTFLFILLLSLITLMLVNGLREFLPLCEDLDPSQEFLRDANGQLILNPQTGKVITTPCKDGSPFLQGVLGFKILLGYVPLIFCGYYLIEDRRRLVFFGRLVITVAIICLLLGLAQYWMLKTGRCQGTRDLIGLDLFRPQLNAKCLVGGSLLYSPSQGQIRLPGTFVSPWHWSWFLIASAAISTVVALSEQQILWRGMGYVGMSLTVINAIICGQRAAFVMVPGIMLLTLSFSLLITGQIANFRHLLSIAAAVIFSLLLLVFLLRFFNPDFIQQRVDSFITRWRTSPPQQFLVEQIQFALEQQRSLLGWGLGKATNSTRAFGNITLVETYHAKLIFEIGLLGLFAFLAFVLHISYLTFRTFRDLKDPFLKNFAASCWIFVFVISLYPQWYPLDTDPVNVYYWFFIGVIFRLRDIENQELKEKRMQMIEDKSTTKANSRPRFSSSSPLH